MRLFATFRLITGLSIALAGAASCGHKETVSPAQEPCATVVTVHLCPGFTAVCPTQHTSLELADGTRLRPSGLVWDAYQPKQLEGQRLRISYALIAQNMYDAPTFTHVLLTCLEAQPLLCGTR